MAGATSAFTSAGSSIAVASSLPATKDAAGFAAVGMTYTDIGEVTEIPEYGPDWALVTHNPLKSKVTQKKKGSVNYGSLALAAAMVPGDAGHVKLLAAESSVNAVSFKITYQDGTVEYFTGLVMGYKRNIGSVDSITAASISIEIDSAVVTVLPP